MMCMCRKQRCKRRDMMTVRRIGEKGFNEEERCTQTAQKRARAGIKGRIAHQRREAEKQ